MARLYPIDLRAETTARHPEPLIPDAGRLRRLFRITQQELAERFGVTRETVARWEIGTRSPGPDHYLEYCAFYDHLADLEQARKRHPSRGA